MSGWNCWTLNLRNQSLKIRLKSPKLLSWKIRKSIFKTLGTSVINRPMSPPSWLLCSMVIKLSVLKIRQIYLIGKLAISNLILGTFISTLGCHISPPPFPSYSSLKPFLDQSKHCWTIGPIVKETLDDIYTYRQTDILVIFLLFWINI